ncbi:MAG: hypothetical protein HXL19_03495, partial [Peptostreptococcus sp.]|nr:hypothetical protein [Peptostreptococcus sp.]
MFKIFKNPIFKQVFYFNLLYANPTITANAMNKKRYGDTPEEIFRGLLTKSYLMSSLFIFIVYTLVFLVAPLREAPYILDYILLVFFLLSVLQTFTHYFNVFYVSKDIEGYMALPIEESIIYKAKMAVVAIGTIQMAIPVWSTSAIYGYKMGLGLMSILYGFIEFILAGALVVIVNMILMELLAKTSVLYRFKNGIITTINIVASISNIAIIIFLQTSRARNLDIYQLGGKEDYGILSGLMKSHLGNLLLIGVMALVIFGVYAVLMRSVNGRFYMYIRRIQEGPGQRTSIKENVKAQPDGVDLERGASVGLFRESKVAGQTDKTSKAKKDKNDACSSLGVSLFKYNLGLINDPTVITQSIVMTCIMPIFVLLPSFLNAGKDGNFLSIMRDNSGLASALIALVVAIFTNAMSTSLPSIIVSLDRENYNYMKSLPISRKKYFMSKLIFSIAVNSILPLLMLVGAYIYIGIPVLDIVYALVLFI